MLRSLSFALSLCALTLSLSAITAHAAQGIDTTTTDLPFSIGGTRMMDLTTAGLTIQSCTISGAGSVTSSNCPFTSNVSSMSSMANSFAGSFTGSALGVYGHGTKWAGYFDGPVNVTGSLKVGGALSTGGDVSTSGNLGTSGNLTVGGTATLQNTGITGQVCLNGTCISAWPTGGDGKTIKTQLYACPTIAIYGSDGGGTGCVGQVSAANVCYTYSTGGSSNGTGHTFQAAHACSAIQ